MKKITNISQNRIEEKWYLVDASAQRVGRVASIVSELLMGKNDPLVRGNLDSKAHVVVVNAEKVDFTPKRGYTKFYKRFSGYPGGLKAESMEEKFKKDPTFVIRNAVKGMLPKTKRGRRMFANLVVESGSEHKHEAQKPVEIKVKEYRM